MKIRKTLAACLSVTLLAGSMGFAASGASAAACSRGQFMRLLAAEAKVNPLIYTGIFKDVDKNSGYSDIL